MGSDPGTGLGAQGRPGGTDERVEKPANSDFRARSIYNLPHVNQGQEAR